MDAANVSEVLLRKNTPMYAIVRERVADDTCDISDGNLQRKAKG